MRLPVLVCTSLFAALLSSSVASALQVTPLFVRLSSGAGTDGTALDSRPGVGDGLATFPFSGTLSGSDGAATHSSTFELSETGFSVDSSLLATDGKGAIVAFEITFQTDTWARYEFSGSIVSSASTGLAFLVTSGPDGYALNDQAFIWFNEPDPSYDFSSPAAGSATGVLQPGIAYNVRMGFDFRNQPAAAFNGILDGNSADIDFLFTLEETAPIPEPGTGLLVGSGLLAVAWARRRGPSPA